MHVHFFTKLQVYTIAHAIGPIWVSFNLSGLACNYNNGKLMPLNSWFVLIWLISTLGQLDFFGTPYCSIGHIYCNGIWLRHIKYIYLHNQRRRGLTCSSASWSCPCWVRCRRRWCRCWVAYWWDCSCHWKRQYKSQIAVLALVRTEWYPGLVH